MGPDKSHARLLTISDVADFLQVSERTVRRWLATGELPAHRLGRRWRISVRDVEDYLRSRRQGGKHYVL